MTKKSYALIFLCVFVAIATLVCGCGENDTESNSFNTQFVTNKGSKLSAQYGIIETEPITTRVGYEFAGWFADSDLKGERIEFPYVPENDGKLYAAWKLTDEKAAVIQVFKDKYNDHSDFISAEKITYSGGKYIYERQYSTTSNNQYLYEFIYDSKNDNFEINGAYVLTFSGNSNKFYWKAATNNSFSWGKFDSGFSFLNEMSYYKDQGVGKEPYLIQTNLYTIKTKSHDNKSAVVEFVANTHNDYSKLLSIYHIEADQQVEEEVLQRIYDESIKWANNFLYYDRITI